MNIKFCETSKTNSLEGEGECGFWHKEVRYKGSMDESGT